MSFLYWKFTCLCTVPSYVSLLAAKYPKSACCSRSHDPQVARRGQFRCYSFVDLSYLSLSNASALSALYFGISTLHYALDLSDGLCRLFPYGGALSIDSSMWFIYVISCPNLCLSMLSLLNQSFMHYVSKIEDSDQSSHEDVELVRLLIPICNFLLF